METISTGKIPNPPKNTWTRRYEFLVVLLMSTVELDNLYFYPLLMQQKGIVFLFQYFIMVAVITLPNLFLGLSLGQFHSGNVVSIWRMCPAFKGIGYVQVLLICHYIVFYGYTMTLVNYHLFTLTGPLFNAQKPKERIMFIEDCFPPFESRNHYLALSDNMIGLCSEGIDKPIYTRWKLNFCALITWILILCGVSHGTYSIVKISYATIIASSLFIFILLVSPFMLITIIKNLMLFWTIHWHVLFDFENWVSAFYYAFFSFNIGLGHTKLLGSCNNFRHNYNKTIMQFFIIVIIFPFIISLFFYFIFDLATILKCTQQKGCPEFLKGNSIYYLMKYQTTKEFLYEGPLLLALGTYTMFLLKMLNNLIIMVESLLAIYKDGRPSRSRHSLLISFYFCIGFLIAQLMVFHNIEAYTANFVNKWPIYMTTVFMQTLVHLVIGFIYGSKRFFRDVEFMLTKRPHKFWRICIFGLTPIIQSIMFYIKLYRLWSYQDTSFWSPDENFNGAFYILPFFILFGCYFHEVYKCPGRNIIEKLIYPFNPAEEWGPRYPYNIYYNYEKGSLTFIPRKKQKTWQKEFQKSTQFKS